jgi:hypothetical protein
MRASPIASAVPFSGPNRGEDRARLIVLSQRALTLDAHSAIERDSPVAV